MAWKLKYHTFFAFLEQKEELAVLFLKEGD